MFDSEMQAESKGKPAPEFTSPARVASRRVRWTVGLGALACAALVAWVLVDKVQEQADLLH